jgi:hypothetical protein
VVSDGTSAHSRLAQVLRQLVRPRSAVHSQEGVLGMQM